MTRLRRAGASAAILAGAFTCVYRPCRGRSSLRYGSIVQASSWGCEPPNRDQCPGLSWGHAVNRDTCRHLFMPPRS
jgi:hypothetical protein